MALSYKLSEVQSIGVMKQDETWVLELQMKYVRYKLVIVDSDLALKLIEELKKTTIVEKKEKPKTKLPRFYADNKGE